AESLTGLTSTETIGKTFDQINIGYEDEVGTALEAFEHPVALCFQEKKPVNKNLFLKIENSAIPVEESVTPVYENGKITGVIATIKNITKCIKTVTAHLKAEKKERLIPICGWCKKIRKENDYWEKLEDFLVEDGFGVFTHGMCPSCADKIFEKKIYLESYQNICKAISTSLSLDEVLQLIVKNVVKVMNVKASLLRLLNNETQQLEVAAYFGLSKKYADKGPVAYDASIDDALAGKSVSTYDITEHEDSTYYQEAMDEGIRSILSIPLRFEKDVIGILRMYTAEPVDYTDEDLKFIEALAEQGAIAIVNARRYESALANEKEYLRVFEEISKAVSSTLNVNELLNMIAKKIPEVMGLKGSSLRLLDKDKKQLDLAAYYGLSEKYANKGPVPYDASIDDALAGKAVSEYDITEHKDSEYYEEAMEEGIRTILSVPLHFRNDIIGVLRLYSSKPINYKNKDLNFMSAIADHTAMAIVNAKHFEQEISKEKEYLRVFEEITKAISSTLDVEKVMNMIVSEIPKVMNLKAATIRLLDSAGEKLILVAASGLSQKYLDRGSIDTEKNVMDALKEKPAAIYDVKTDERVKYPKEMDEEGIKSILTVPILARGKVMGILRLLTVKNRKFSQQEIDFVASLAEVSGIAIENATMYEKSQNGNS
ncbi:MAG TPA: GAF domain-containing protein, partial [Nitrospirae bacterium]|nr:GAF domain-containing protein [Nitrospirota bacterium]HEW81086.1 GAF domain-containing protein [Nitrospirota bacterium]